VWDQYPRLGDLAEDVRDPRPSDIGARLRIGMVDATTAASGFDRATVTVDGLPIVYDASYSPTVGDIVYWLEDEQRRVVCGKLA
jgi:hypothetical protein